MGNFPSKPPPPSGGGGGGGNNPGGGGGGGNGNNSGGGGSGKPNPDSNGEKRNMVDFSINGKPYRIDTDLEKWTSDSVLVDYIRDKAVLKGTKYMCREGGCGACVVAVKSQDPNTGKNTMRPINSCLAPIFGCEGWDIHTVEKLGNSSSGYDAIQQKLIEYNGAQCGFCTPGMVMHMHGLLESKGGKVTSAEIEENFDGNICRCTGYRPILDAFKSLSSDNATRQSTNDTKLTCTSCPDAGRCCSSSTAGDIENCGPCPSRGSCQSAQNGLVEARQDRSIVTLRLRTGQVWVKVPDLTSLMTTINKFRGEQRKYRFVAGDTAKGVYKNDGPYQGFIEIRSVQELAVLDIVSNEVVIGGIVTIAKAIEYLQKVSTMSGYEHCKRMANHLLRVANSNVRNAGTFSGNVTLKRMHPEFPSDVFTVLASVGTKIRLASPAGDSKPYDAQMYSMKDFMTASDTNGKVILSFHIPQRNGNYFYRSYKVSRRYQNAHAYVNGGFLLKLDSSSKVVEKPIIVFGGISPSFINASKTENFLNGKSLVDKATLKGALDALQQEIIPESPLPDPSVDYKRILTQVYLYKTILAVVGDKSNAFLKSGSEEIKRGPMTAMQTFEREPIVTPLYQPMHKLDLAFLTSGEDEFINDIQPLFGELFGVFVFSTVGRATLKNIDASQALAVPGVATFLTAKDIPGQNNYLTIGADVLIEGEQIFADSQIKYAGQPLGMILAENRDIAIAAAKLVSVSYDNVQTPDIDIGKVVKASQDAGTYSNFFTIDASSAWSTPGGTDTITNTIKGKWRIGSQYHFQFETQTCICIPKEDGYDVYSSTQWMDQIQGVVASSLAIPNNSVNVSVRRLGGAFGAKITKAGLIACAAAVGAYKTRRSIRVVQDLEANMCMIGKRLPYYITYEVGFNDDGKIASLNCDILCDCGASLNEPTCVTAAQYFQNVYEAVGWSVRPGRVRTNTPPNTYTRAPGYMQGVSAIEYIMDHIAFTLKKDPLDVRLVNLIQNGDPFPAKGYTFQGENPVPKMLREIKTTGDYDNRVKFVADFNKANRWKKRGMAVSFTKFYSEFYDSRYTVLVSIYHEDGTVSVTHGGIEMGQGISTKVAQVVATQFGISLDYVKVKPSNNLTAPNAYNSAGSVTSELCCHAAAKASQILLDRIAPYNSPGTPWATVVANSFSNRVDLSASYMYSVQVPSDIVQTYDIWCVNMIEVEIDVLTGEHKIVRLDLLEDTGKSLNPAVDIGQIEGGLVMGLGLWTTEKVVHDPNTGELITRNTWEYKPPEPRDIPEDFRINLLKNSPNAYGVLRSKAVAEPPVCTTVVVFLALRHAIQSARQDIGNTDWFQLDGPVLPEDIVRTCLTSTSQFDF